MTTIKKTCWLTRSLNQGPALCSLFLLLFSHFSHKINRKPCLTKKRKKHSSLFVRSLCDLFFDGLPSFAVVFEKNIKQIIFWSPVGLNHNRSLSLGSR